MRVTREQAAENRERIVATAARLFRDKGFDGVGVDTIMKTAGLTHGGFYGHFESKDALAGEAIEQAFRQSAEKLSGAATLGELVAEYLSDRHWRDRADGCALAALGGDLGRQAPAVRRSVTASLRRQLDRLVSVMRRDTAATRRRRAIATLAGMVGALTLARAVDDSALAKEILAAARQSFGKELAA
jgi:TetR/AcrR family transcriptional repressor of nem operon